MSNVTDPVLIRFRILEMCLAGNRVQMSPRFIR
jgi:hypothetical protein